MKRWYAVRRTTRALGASLVLSCCLVTCRHASAAGDARHTPDAPAPAPPSVLLGTWEDDYGGRFALAEGSFLQGTRSRYRIIKWAPRGQYFIAQNDDANPSAPNRFTRVDWLTLSGMAPSTWAFCFSAFDASTAIAAEAATIANRSAPMTGCNTFPFTRMRPASH